MSNLISSPYVDYIQEQKKQKEQIRKEKQKVNVFNICCYEIESYSTRLRLKNKPIGIDIESHQDRDKRIHFKKIDAIKYLKSNKKKFDLILIKQTIHLLNFNVLTFYI